MLLTIRNVDLGIQECRIDLNQLFPDDRSRAKFEDRWLDFYRSDAAHLNVYSRAEKDTLTYLSESFIPTTTDDRHPLLLLLGNPASHSVSSGMCFAFEGNGREHRFWIALRKVQLLIFRDLAGSGTLPPDERNRLRKHQLFDLDYSSAFRIGIVVFYSMPSPASSMPWSGVNGIRKLLGQKAFDRITDAEQQRVSQVIQSFIPKKGGMMVFQRDAYEAVRQMTGPHYSLDLAIAGELCSSYRYNPNVSVMGVAPTRYMLAGKVRDSLTRYASHLAATLVP